MPIYAYRCAKCGKAFELVQRMSELASAKHRCPQCGSERVTRVLSTFFAKTSRKS